MTKKSRKALQPSLALAMVAFAAPILAANAPLYAAETAHSIFDTSLFSPVEFRLQRRRLHPASPPEVPRGKPGSQTSSVMNASSSSQASQSSVSSSSASEESLIFESLTGEQRETLRRQLRSHACPQEAEAAYRALCERLLSAQPPQKFLKGLTNPDQPQ